MSNCYPTYRTSFDRAMQRQHSDCCLPEKHEPCYPQTPAKRENYAFASEDEKKCHKNLITLLAKDGSGTTPPLNKNNPLSCHSFGQPPECVNANDQATCESNSGGGGDFGKCTWDTTNSRCMPNFEYMQNLCNSSAQVTQIEDKCKDLPQSQCTNDDCEWSNDHGRCEYKIDKYGRSAYRSATQFENCKWVGKPDGSGYDKEQSWCVSAGVGQCTPGSEFQMPSYPGGPLSQCPSNKVQCTPNANFINAPGGPKNSLPVVGNLTGCICQESYQSRLGDVYQPRHLSTRRDWRRPINDVTGNCSIM